MPQSIKTLFLTSLAAASVVMPDAAAKSDNGKGHGRGNDDGPYYYDSKKFKKEYRRNRNNDSDHHSHSHYDDDRVLVRLDEPRVVVIRERLQPYYVKRCPPGLAKKRNGCLPPGHARSYVIGQPLPNYVEYWSVPQDVLVNLPQAPHGAQYVWVDRDILLISEASKKVLDAVVILSAI